VDPLDERSGERGAAPRTSPKFSDMITGTSMFTAIFQEAHSERAHENLPDCLMEPTSDFSEAGSSQSRLDRKTEKRNSIRKAIAKAVTWRLIGTAEIFAIAFWTTGHIATAGHTAALAAITSIVMYVAHELAWGQT
jgi:uncharacterized membrane protein